MRIERSNVPITNFITGELPASSLQWPGGVSVWRGIFGQRQIRVP